MLWPCMLLLVKINIYDLISLQGLKEQVQHYFLIDAIPSYLIYIISVYEPSWDKPYVTLLFYHKNYEVILQ